MPSLNISIDKKLIILPAASCLVVVLLVLLVISPLKSRITQTKEAHFDNQLKGKSLTFQTQQHDVSGQLNQDIKNDQLEIDQTIPAENETLKLITALESLADSLGITNQNFSLSELKSSDTGFNTIIVNIDFTANYATFVNYLNQLENSSTYINVDSVSASLIESTGSAEGVVAPSESISFHITAQTYWRGTNE